MATLVITPEYEVGVNAPYWLNVFAMKEWTEQQGLDVEYMRRMSDEGEIRLKLKENSLLPAGVFHITEIHEIPVTITAPAKFNVTKAFIHHPELFFLTSYDLELHLKEYGVIKAENDRNLRRAVLHFNRGHTPQLPQTILLGWDRVRVKPEKPRPRRCYNCQAYGHVAAVCKNTPVCARCAGKHEEDEDDCIRPFCCAACGGNHTVFSKLCKVWTEECQVAKIRHDEKISYKDALLRRQQNIEDEQRRRQQQQQEDLEEDDTDMEEDTEEESEEEGQETTTKKTEEHEEKNQQREEQAQKTSDQSRQTKRPNTRHSDDDTTRQPGGWQPVSSRKKRK